MLQDKLIKQIIEEEGFLTDKSLKQAIQYSKKEHISLLEYIINKKLVKDDILFEAISKKLKIPFISIKDKTIRQDILFLIPEPLARTHETIAFDKKTNTLFIATSDPTDIEIFEFIKKRTGLDLKIYLTSPSSIKSALKQYKKRLEQEFKAIGEQKIAISDSKLSKLATEMPVVRLVNALLEYAIFENASDIHIEPFEHNIRIRFRIDGVLREIMTLPRSMLAGIVARIKILSNLKIDEHRLPQDGRFKIETPEYKISFRVSVMPVFDGEKVVMRLLNEGSQLLDLEKLGLSKKNLEKLKIHMKKPNGMILVTGPTGSGKTTTLYSILNAINSTEINIATIEDPIEYRIPHINQSQVNTKIGFTFAKGLRALLRQDPDVILVGEIRDTETAEIAIHAAMTGHLVLSTLHTNEASATVPRLLDMGVLPFLVASTTNLIIAQRLVRKICKNCIYSYNLDKESMKMIEKQVDLKSLIKALEKEEVIMPGQKLESLLFFRGKGCKKCGGTGYKGRIGIYEVLEITNNIQKLILKKSTTEEIREAGIKQGMVTLLQDGFIKAKTGITTIEEVLRVSKE